MARLLVRPAANVASIEGLPELMAAFTGLVEEIEAVMATDVPRARTGLQKILGSIIPVRPAADGTHLEALIGFGFEAEAAQVIGLPIIVVPRAGI